MYQQQYQQGGYAPQNQGGYAPQNQNVYVGSAKFQQGQYGLMVSISLNAEDIAKLQANLNQNGWVTFSLRERQQPSQSGATHYGVIRPPMDNQGGGYQQGYQQPRPPQGYQQRPPQGYATNMPNRPNMPYRQNAGGNGAGQYRQGYPQPPQAPTQYQQPAPPPQQPGYDNGGFNQAPAPTQYQQVTPPPAPAPQYQQPAPAAPGNEHRYGPADAQPPAADDGQEPSLDNGMPM